MLNSKNCTEYSQSYHVKTLKELFERRLPKLFDVNFVSILNVLSYREILRLRFGIKSKAIGQDITKFREVDLPRIG